MARGTTVLRAFFVMTIELEFHVERKPWMKNPNLRWNAGLTEAGLQWRQHFQRAHYPAQSSSSTYRRTGTLANKSNYKITKEGRGMELQSTNYLKYLLDGTGIFGPRAAPIRPVTKKFLAWKGSSMIGGKKSTGWIFAREVKGTKWFGKLEELKQAMIEAFKKGVSQFGS